MIKNLKNILVYKISKTKIYLCFALVFSKNGYLYENGFVESWLRRYPISKDLNPIPWWPYNFTHFLNLRLRPEFKLFEYGSGNSTLYLQNKVSSIISIENNLLWFNKLSFLVHSRKNLIFVNDEDYVDAIGSDKYDIICIDGIKRNECVYKCINNLTYNGIIIIDDTDRVEYNEAKLMLLESGFKNLDFTGLAPCSINSNSTSIFYKKNNIFNI
jgi:hypothetical protein